MKIYLLHKRGGRRQHKTVYVDDDIDYNILICIYIMKKNKDVEHQ